MTDVDERDFAQFGGSLASKVTANPEFTARVRTRIHGSAAAPMMPQPVSIAPPGPVVARPPSPRRGASARRWLDRVGAAAIILLALAVVASGLMLVAPGSDMGRGFMASEDINAGNINVGGNAGRTWVISEHTPDIQGFRRDPDIAPSDTAYSAYFSSLVTGNQLVYSVADDQGNTWIVTYDLDRHETVWKVPGFTNGPLASDGDRVFVNLFDPTVTSNPSRQPAASRVTALNLQTGAIEWQGPVFNIGYPPIVTVLLAGTMIYGSDSMGNVQALDSASGEPQWRYPSMPSTSATPLANPGSEISGSSRVYTPTMAANTDSLFATQPDGRVLAFDRKTGTLRGGIDTREEVDGNVDFAYIQATDEHVAVTAITPQAIDGRVTLDPPASPATLLVFDPGSFDVQKTVNIPDLSSIPVLTADAVYLGMSLDPEEPAHLYTIGYGADDAPTPVAIDTIVSTSVMSVTAAGNTLIVVSDSNVISLVDRTTGEVTGTATMGTTDPVLSQVGQPQRWGADILILTADGKVFVLTSGNDASATPIATPFAQAG